jgi:hypothetical protein
MSAPTPSSAFTEPAGGRRGIYRVLTTVETSTFSGGMPPYPLITDAFRRALPFYASGEEYRKWGVWIGPGPRVVRHQTAFASAYRTYATWVAYWPDDENTRDHFEYLLQHLVEGLPQILKSVTKSTDWSQITVSPYEPNVNGPLHFWESGSAAATRSRDVSGGALTGALENPIGPDHLVPSPPSLVGSAGRWLLVAGVVGGLVWVLSKEGDPYQERLPYRR